MAQEAESAKVKEPAGGWITERADAKVPGFLKLAYVGFSIFGFVYLFLYWAGETGQKTRGPLVREANKVMATPATPLLALIAVILVGFVGWLFYTALRSGGAES